MNCTCMGVIALVSGPHRFVGLDWSAITLLGFAGNLVFSTRFFLQWLASEKAGRSVIPRSFWHWSIFGSVLLCVYFAFRRDPVGMLAFLPNTFIYFRNLQLDRNDRDATVRGNPLSKSEKVHA